MVNPNGIIIDITNYNFYSWDKNNHMLTLINKNTISNEDKCGTKEIITYYLPINTGDNLLKYKYQNIIKQNHHSKDEESDYDIFNPKAAIYNSICTTITCNLASENIDEEDSFDNFDMTLNNRRNYYFQEKYPYVLKVLLILA